MPRLRERDGFARYTSPVLVGNPGREIDLILEAHVGLNSSLVSPNAVLRWMNVRVRGVDEALSHPNIPGHAEVCGWHEHVWNDVYGAKEIRPMDTPPHGLRAFFKHVARMWNIRILKDQEPMLDD